MMKCPFCLTENTEGNYSCSNCHAFLLHGKKLSQAHVDYLLENGYIDSFDDLMQLKTIVVSCRCDDGVGLPPGVEMEIEVPLYYNEREIISVIQQKGVRPDVDDVFFHIDEFHDDHHHHPNGLGAMVLAEAMADNLQKLMLHVMVNTRHFMMSRAAPDVCLYGCPAASGLEEKFARTGQTTEIIHFEKD